MMNKLLTMMIMKKSKSKRRSTRLVRPFLKRKKCQLLSMRLYLQLKRLALMKR
jgi:hypothetical protein